MRVRRVPVRVILSSKLVPSQAHGWTPLPRLIIMRPGYHNVNNLAHELMHVLQAEKYGHFWPLVYAAQWARYKFDYWSMPFEIEAYAAHKNPEIMAWAHAVLDQGIEAEDKR